MNKMLKSTLRMANGALASCVLFSGLCFAQGESRDSTDPAPSVRADRWRSAKANLGFLAGYADTERNYKQALEYGIEASARPRTKLGYGAELSTTRTDTETENNSLQRTKLLAKGTYTFGGNTPLIRDTYAGAAIGPVIDTTGGKDNLRMGVAPVVGFDIPVSKDTENQAVSVGMDAKYLLVSDAAVDMFSVNGMVKYWF